MRQRCGWPQRQRRTGCPSPPRRPGWGEPTLQDVALQTSSSGSYSPDNGIEFFLHAHVIFLLTKMNRKIVVDIVSDTV